MKVRGRMLGVVSRTLEGRAVSVHVRALGLDMGMRYLRHFSYPEMLFSKDKAFSWSSKFGVGF